MLCGGSNRVRDIVAVMIGDCSDSVLWRNRRSVGDKAYNLGRGHAMVIKGKSTVEVDNEVDVTRIGLSEDR